VDDRDVVRPAAVAQTRVQNQNQSRTGVHWWQECHDAEPSKMDSSQNQFPV
jgi:hypothetical protein